jgi:hypothetical protein
MQRFMVLIAIAFLSLDALCTHEHQIEDMNGQEYADVIESRDFTLGPKPPINVDKAIKCVDLDKKERQKEEIRRLEIKSHWDIVSVLFVGMADPDSALHELHELTDKNNLPPFINYIIIFNRKCYFFGRNKCKSGNTCPYIHDRNFIRPPKSEERKQKESERKKKKKKESKTQKQAQNKLSENNKDINERQLVNPSKLKSPKHSNHGKNDKVVRSPAVKYNNITGKNMYRNTNIYPTISYIPVYIYPCQLQYLHNEENIRPQGNDCPYSHIDPNQTQTALPQPFYAPVVYLPVMTYMPLNWSPTSQQIFKK